MRRELCPAAAASHVRHPPTLVARPARRPAAVRSADARSAPDQISKIIDRPVALNGKVLRGDARLTNAGAMARSTIRCAACMGTW
jgi:hypothetical protein